MTSIHMDVEQVKAVLDLMMKDDVEINDTLSALYNGVKGIDLDKWVGHAAEEFHEEYDNLHSEWKRHVEALEMLAERLRQEIEEWEAHDRVV